MANIDRVREPIDLEVLEDVESVDLEVAPEDVEVEYIVDVETGDLLDAIEELLFEEVPHEANLVEYIPESELAVLASDLIQEVENDLHGRSEWEAAIVDGMKYLGINPSPKNIPWEGASNVVHPLIMEAVVRFQSESITETFPASGPVRTKIIGEETPTKIKAARRVEEDLNYQLTEVMTEFRGEHERMLWDLAIKGSAFKKVYFDPRLNRQVSSFVPADDMIIPYGVSDISLAERITHRMRKTSNEVRRLQYDGFYVDTPLQEPSSTTATEIQQAQDEEVGYSANFDNRHLIYEIHTELDLVGFEDTDSEGIATGVALPYVVTIEVESMTVLAIRRNYDEGDISRRKRDHFVHYTYIPGFGAYGMGLLHLVGNSAASATSLQRQLIDAGTLANLPGGLKTRGLRVKNENEPIAPGEFRDVDVVSGTLKENIVPLPYKEPSQTLLALMGVVVEDAQRLASTLDLKISDMSAQAPVGTTLAIIERSLKILSAVQSRLHFALKQELKLIAGVIRDYANPEYEYEVEGGRQVAREEDFSMVEIIPVSDPSASTMAQRVVQYQAVMQMAETAPQLYDMPQLHRQMIEVLGIKDAEKLVKLEDDMEAADPVTENMNVLMGKPIKAFQYQDHEAHIRVHMAALEDPKIMEAMGQNPKAQSMFDKLHAHIAEHIAYAYRSEIEKSLPEALPGMDEELPPHVEVELSRAVAIAADQLLQRNTAEQLAKQNEAAANDPVVQLQQRKMAHQEGELDLKRQKLAVDAAAAADKLALQREIESLKLELEAFKAGAKVATEEAKIEADREKAGLSAGVDIGKTKARIDADLEMKGLEVGVDIAKTHQAAEQAKQEAERRATEEGEQAQAQTPALNPELAPYDMEED